MIGGFVAAGSLIHLLCYTVCNPVAHLCLGGSGPPAAELH